MVQKLPCSRYFISMFHQRHPKDPVTYERKHFPEYDFWQINDGPVDVKI